MATLQRKLKRRKYRVRNAQKRKEKKMFLTEIGNSSGSVYNLGGGVSPAHDVVTINPAPINDVVPVLPTGSPVAKVDVMGFAPGGNDATESVKPNNSPAKKSLMVTSIDWMKSPIVKTILLTVLLPGGILYGIYKLFFAKKSKKHGNSIRKFFRR